MCTSREYASRLLSRVMMTSPCIPAVVVMMQNLGIPLQQQVRLLFLVTGAVSPINDREPSFPIEMEGALVSFKGPEPQSLRCLFCLVEQQSSNTEPLMAGQDIEMINPAFAKSYKSDTLPIFIQRDKDSVLSKNAIGKEVQILVCRMQVR